MHPVEASGSNDDLRLPLRAAMLYYVDGLTHAAIAQRLGVSRATSGRLVARAKAEGLVRIEIVSPEEQQARANLERALEDELGLAEAVVVAGGTDNSEAIAASTGAAAARVLTRRVRKTDRVGVAWGQTMSAMANSLPKGAARCSEVVMIDGPTNSAAFHTRGEYVVSRCADALGATGYLLAAPLYADPATVTSLRQDSVISQTLDRGRNCDIALFSVGDVSTSATLFADSLLHPEMLDELAGLGAVGDACGRFFRLDGSAVEGPLVERTVSIGLDDLRDVPVSVLAAGGARKAEAVRGAINAGIVDVLVTDEDVAQAILSAPQASKPSNKRKATP